MDGMKWVGNVWYGKRDCYNSENTQFTLPFGAPRTLAYILCFILFNRKNSVGRILFLLFFSFHLAHTFRARRVRCIRLICCLCFGMLLCWFSTTHPCNVVRAFAYAYERIDNGNAYFQWQMSHSVKVQPCRSYRLTVCLLGNVMWCATCCMSRCAEFPVLVPWFVHEMAWVCISW